MEKDNKAGGRLDRGIELGEERRLERHKEDDEHMGKKNEPSSNQIYQIQHHVLSYKCPSYRVRYEHLWRNGASVSFR